MGNLGAAESGPNLFERGEAVESYWQIWRMGVREADGDIGMSWGDDRDDWYDEGRAYGRRLRGLR